MALKIKQNGEIKDLIIPACGVSVLDMEDNFGSSNLEEVLQELGDSDSIYISDETPDKDGIWISSDNTSTVAQENPILVELKDYVDTNVTPKVNKNTNSISQLSNPNLLINGDFQVWQRGTIFSYKGNVTGQRNIYTADRWRLVQSADDLMCSVSQLKDANGVYFSISDFSKSKSTQVTLHQKLEPWSLQAGIYTLSYEYANTSTIEFNSRIFSFARNNNIILSEKYSSNGQSNWSKYSITFEITPDDIGKIIEIDFDLGGAQAYSNGTFYLRNVKLELGSVATPFVPKPYSQELADCQRYYEKVVDSHGFATCHGYGTNTVRCVTKYLPKRVSPTVTISALSTFLVEIGNSDTIVPTGYASQYFDPYGNGFFIFNVSNVANGLAGRVKRSDKGTAYIEFDAEIY